MSIDIEKSDRIVTITINRPEALNTLDLETRAGLTEAFREFHEDDDLWVAILTGAGEKAFCAGADIKKYVIPSLAQNAWARRKVFLTGQDIFPTLENLTKPVIAAINGFALGGGLELALCCDIRIASENAILGLPEISIGIMPGSGGTQRLSRVVGLPYALQMTLTGERIDADEAYRINLVTRVVPPEDLIKTAREIANNICQKAPLGVRFAKEAIRRGAEANLTDGLRLENLLFALVRETKDAAEGTTAFAEKRKPSFKGE